MIPGDPPPEIPPPGIPQHPRRTPDDPQPVTPAVVPRVPMPEPWTDPEDRLRADRRLLLMGPLDHPTADRLCAELMLADGRSADPIELIVNSPGGPIEAVLGVLDVIGLLRAPLGTRCIGAAAGTAAAVVASGTATRSVAAHATLCLRLDHGLRLDGRADEIARGAAAIADSTHRLAGHVADASHMSVDEVARALRDGGHLSASDAHDAGLVDEIARG